MTRIGNKRYTDWERRHKTLFADDMITYIENMKEPTAKRNLLKLIHNYSKVAVYMVNTQKLIAFLYIINEQWI